MRISVGWESLVCFLEALKSDKKCKKILQIKKFKIFNRVLLFFKIYFSKN